MIIHFSTLHSPQSTRIYHKYVKATNESGVFSALYFCGGKSELKTPNNVIQISGSSGSKLLVRLKNLILGTCKIIAKRPKYVQLHDPELLISALFFRIFFIKVIYDSHENFPSQFTSHNVLYKRLELFIEFSENILIKFFVNHVVAATSEIYQRFDKFHNNVSLVENGPRKKPEIIKKDKVIDFFYAGLISPNRGILEVLNALEGSGAKIVICGPFSSESYRQKCINTHFWRSGVSYRGVVTQHDVKNMMRQSRYGIVSLCNTKNYEDSRPTKFYEYLSNNAKVIVSKIPYMEAAVYQYKLGYVFDIEKGDSIRQAFNDAVNDDVELDTSDLDSFLGSVNYFDEQLCCFLRKVK